MGILNASTLKAALIALIAVAVANRVAFTRQLLNG
jgi:hypothetical protein